MTEWENQRYGENYAILAEWLIITAFQGLNIDIKACATPLNKVLLGCVVCFQLNLRTDVSVTYV